MNSGCRVGPHASIPYVDRLVPGAAAPGVSILPYRPICAQPRLLPLAEGECVGEARGRPGLGLASAVRKAAIPAAPPGSPPRAGTPARGTATACSPRAGHVGG